MAFSLDSWSVVLYSTDILVNLVFIPFSLLLAYVCITQKSFHPNFRFLIQVQNICNVVSTMQRLLLVSSRLCCLGNSLTLIINNTFILVIFSGFLSIFSWAALAIERVLALIHCEKYEKNYAGWHVYVVFLLPAIILSAGIVCGFIYISNSISEDLSGLGIVLLHTMLVLITATIEMVLHLSWVASVAWVVQHRRNQLGATHIKEQGFFGFVAFTSFCSMSFPIVLKCNKTAFERRHSQNLNMTTRYQLDENIRATRYILPVAFLVVIYKLALSALLIYSAFFQSLHLGKDGSHLSHIYNLLGSCIRLITTTWLVMNSGKFRCSNCKKTRRLEESPHHLEAEQYFKDLRKMWE